MALLPVRFAMENADQDEPARPVNWHYTDNPSKRRKLKDGSALLVYSDYTPKTARERVLETTELFENILSYLPANQILVDQRVCKTWRNCYQGSRQLKLKTFETVEVVLEGEVKNGDLRGWQYDIITALDDLDVMAGVGSSTPTTAKPPESTDSTSDDEDSDIEGTADPITPGMHDGIKRQQVGANKTYTFEVNPLLFSHAGRHPSSPLTLGHTLKGIRGIKQGELVVRPDEKLLLSFCFDHFRQHDTWQQPHTGSWTKQYITEPAFEKVLMVIAGDERTQRSKVIKRVIIAIVAYYRRGTSAGPNHPRVFGAAHVASPRRTMRS